MRNNISFESGMDVVRTPELPKWLRSWTSKHDQELKNVDHHHDESDGYLGSTIGNTIFNERVIVSSNEQTYTKSLDTRNHYCMSNSKFKSLNSSQLQIHLPTCKHYDKYMTFGNVLMGKKSNSTNTNESEISKTAGNTIIKDEICSVSVDEHKKVISHTELHNTGPDIVMHHSSPYTALKGQTVCGCPQIPLMDDLRNYAYEGEGSSPGSLSSCCSGTQLHISNVHE